MPIPDPSLFPHFPAEDCRAHRHLIEEAIQRVIESGNFILGEEVAAFEREFAEFLGIGHAVGVASGTDAIELMLRALDIGEGDRVVVPSLTASATAAGVRRAGAEVLFADCEADSFTLCAQSLDAVLKTGQGRHVKAALVVHLYGQTANWEELQRVTDDHGILLLEDAAQAHGAKWRARYAGTLGRAAAFSFYPTKNLAALGDAGAVTTDDKALAERMLHLRQYGWQKRHISEETGVNSRLDEMQAAILRAKLPRLTESITQRQHLADVYRNRLRECAVKIPGVAKDNEHAFHLYVIRSPRRDALMHQLSEAGIPVSLHYPAALHQQPAYADRELAPLPLPETERAVAEILTLPLHPYLSENAVNLVCDMILEFHHATP